ncbi:DegV family protein [Radiobacillus kanasensis]|uniref:DegV family protein n=1 Tax=Radiobacillus kanasensis TaxID=2844358 RepID=UPI001E2A6A41|nr:DegV family protein [Radiobacillus kanasensis]UFU00536.1 DegV family protein [Radiobacillus kanasensis]
MNVKILADSACDLGEESVKQYDIDILSLTVQLDDQNFEDGKTISAKTVYDAMRNGKAPKTSQVSPQTFKDVFTKYAEQNQPCIYPAFSSELSGTYQAAKLMEQEVKEAYPDWQFEIIDTKGASLGLGLVVLRAAKMAQEGKDFSSILEMSKYHAEHMEHIFTVDDLEYLYRGGRVSKTAAFVGTLLKIKPLLHMEDGKLIPLEKIRGSKKVFKRMLEVMEERGVDLRTQPIGISHGDDLETATLVSDMIKETFHNDDIHIEMVGSSIGAHAGPGTIAIFFLNHPYK